MGLIDDDRLFDAEPRTRDIARSLYSGIRNLPLVSPHGHTEPRWYAEKERVPTWNYAAVHAYGKVRGLHEPADKRAAVAGLVACHDPQWLPEYERLSETYMSGMLNGIVAFEVEVTRLDTRWKLSQNRGRQEMELIAAELEKSADSAERATAALTRKHLVTQ